MAGGVRLAIGTTKIWIREGRGKGGEDPETPERAGEGEGEQLVVGSLSRKLAKAGKSWQSKNLQFT